MVSWVKENYLLAPYFGEKKEKMIHLNRRQVAFTAGTALAAAAVTASSTSAQARPSRTQGAQRRRPTLSRIQAVACPIEFNGASARLTLSGKESAPGVPVPRPVGTSWNSGPLSMTLANNGDQVIPAGRRLSIITRGLDAAGLVTDLQQPLVISDVEAGARSWLSVVVAPMGASQLVLKQPLAAGQEITVRLFPRLNRGVDARALGQVQVLASLTLSRGAEEIFEIQSPEFLATRL